MDIGFEQAGFKTVWANEYDKTIAPSYQNYFPDTKFDGRSISSVRHPFKGDKIWKTADGSWLIVDEVLGKHEMITYAVGINSKGEILGIEIMEYVESYGYEIQGDDWRRQFIGKTASHPIKLNQDIQNISGATLSAKHVTDGVKRVMALYDIALKSE